MANHAHKPTEASRKEVSAYAAVGTPHHDIARLVGLSIKTLLKHYRHELDTGKARATAQVAKTLFQMATQEKNTAAAIFWMKAQAGWRDRSEVEMTGNMGAHYVVEVQAPTGGTDEWLKQLSSGGRSQVRKSPS